MINDKGILIKNIYYMLTYAFQVLRQTNYKEIAVEDFENIHDMFAAILGKGIGRQLKQGLYREYVTKDEDLSVKRGKILIAGTVKNRIQHKQMLDCEYDELSENNIFNQILKTTALLLIRQPGVKAERKSTLKKEMLLFDKVDYIEAYEIRWDSLRFQKNNQEYRMLLNICNLVLQGLLLSTDTGEVKMATFLDEQRMCRLYEKFILEYYRHHHPELNANPDRIDWDTDKDKLELLPVMQTDITLKKNARVLIIDAKYYAHNLQTQYDTQTIHSANLYQIFTYVKNLDKDNTGNVAGMLLYARTQDQIQPNNTYRMGVNQISVQTLDLNLPFAAIANQMEKIVEDYLSSEEKRQVEVQYGY